MRKRTSLVVVRHLTKSRAANRHNCISWLVLLALNLQDKFSFSIIVSILSISEKKSPDSREYLIIAAFSDEAS